MFSAGFISFLHGLKIGKNNIELIQLLQCKLEQGFSDGRLGAKIEFCFLPEIQPECGAIIPNEPSRFWRAIDLDHQQSLHERP